MKMLAPCVQRKKQKKIDVPSVNAFLGPCTCIEPGLSICHDRYWFNVIDKLV